ncbi:MAG: Membrane-associated zinc metalloprotease [Microgenomates bacterium 39_7]|nr:MAG: Membrane-associated zinc metalloprotease [Microgenomates bacterium 39_7]
MHIIIVILIISFLILIHELGHFFAAIKTKTKVEEFGIGYPPRLLKLFTYKGTEFTLNLIPFGGFVRLEGEMGPEEEDLNKEADREKFSTSRNVSALNDSIKEPYYKKSISQRALIVSAGVIMNVLFALIAFSVVFSFIGIPTAIIDQARIGYIAPNSPAQDAKLPINVNIVEIKSDSRVYEVNNFSDVQRAIGDNRGSTLEIVVTAQCEDLECPEEFESYQVYARTEQETPSGEGSIGVGFEEMVFRFYPWYEMPFRGTWYGIRQAISLGWIILRALGDMFFQLFSRGTVPQDVAGPVGIVHEAGKGNIISSDFWSNLGFAGMLSLNLAIMNLLPIPALDGGKVLFLTLEKIFGHKKIQKIEGYANYGGFALIVILIIAITIKDIGRIVSG